MLKPSGVVCHRANKVGGIAACTGFQGQLDQDILIIVNPEGRSDGEHVLVLIHGLGGGV